MAQIDPQQNLSALNNTQRSIISLSSSENKRRPFMKNQCTSRTLLKKSPGKVPCDFLKTFIILIVRDRRPFE